MSDFVPFDLAMKLKDKGYTLDTAHHYDDNGGIVVSLVEFDERCVYPCPEIHQVLKWLREKNIYIELVIAADAEYMCDIYNIDARPIKCLGSTEYSKTYEAAALAGIEYCLDNLI